MLTWMRRLHGKPGTARALEWDPRVPVVFLSLPPSLEHGIDPGASQEEIRARVCEAVRHISGPDGFVPFSYSGPGGRRLPLFTNTALAREFAEAYVKECGRIMPFEVLTTDTSVLDALVAACDVVVVNDRTTEMREFAVRS